jgi:RNA polymerase-interacting CarD/CdnL/TRCF family regulator
VSTVNPSLSEREEAESKARYAMSQLRKMAETDWAARYEHDDFFMRSADAIGALLSTLERQRERIGQIRAETIEECAGVVDALARNASQLKLNVGEMTRQELRTAQAVLILGAVQIRALRRQESAPPRGGNTR